MNPVRLESLSVPPPVQNGDVISSTVLLFNLFLLLGVNPVRLEALSVPPLVQNGTVYMTSSVQTVLLFKLLLLSGVNPVLLESFSVPPLVQNGTVLTSSVQTVLLFQPVIVIRSESCTAGVPECTPSRTEWYGYDEICPYCTAV